MQFPGVAGSVGWRCSNTRNSIILRSQSVALQLPLVPSEKQRFHGCNFFVTCVGWMGISFFVVPTNYHHRHFTRSVQTLTSPTSTGLIQTLLNIACLWIMTVQARSRIFILYSNSQVCAENADFRPDISTDSFCGLCGLSAKQLLCVISLLF